jgi:hypothetical protein
MGGSNNRLSFNYPFAPLPSPWVTIVDGGPLVLLLLALVTYPNTRWSRAFMSAF